MGSNYTIVGDEPVLIANKIAEILRIYQNVDYDRITLDMEESSIISLLEELQTYPFLQEHKIIIAKNCNFIYDSKKIDEKLLEEFSKYLSNPLETSTLIVIIDKKVEASNKVFSELKKYSNVNNLILPDSNEIDEYLMRYLAGNQFMISKRALDELLLRTSHNLQLTLCELDKLMIYKDNDKNIDLNDIVLMVNKNLDDNIFTLIDFVLKHDTSRAIEMYNDMKVLNEDEGRIISSLLNKFNEMYEIKSLVASKYTKDDIASLYNVKASRVYYMMKNASESGMKEIKRNINKLTDLDYNIKSGKIEKRVGFELYLLSIALK